jgi:dihydroorotate dehydrogenase (fumarate)
MSLITRYLGLTLKNPMIASASPLAGKIDNLRLLEDAGAAAIVLPSLFQEQIEAETENQAARVAAFAESSPEALSYFPAAATRPYGLYPERYLDFVRRATEAVSIPIIASLNGSTRAGWIEYSKHIEQAGASAIELNMYLVPINLLESGREIEAHYIDIVEAVCGSIHLPVSVKLTPYLSAIGHFAVTLAEHGAAGFVLFNRLMEPDTDLSQMKLTHTLELSDPAELRLPLLWAAILAGRVDASLAISTGIRTTEDVVKSLLAGADAVMTTSALLRYGAGYMATLSAGLGQWMEEREIASVADIRGRLSCQRSQDRSVYTRTDYLHILEHYPASAENHFPFPRID